MGFKPAQQSAFLCIGKGDRAYDDTADRQWIESDLVLVPPGHRKMLEQEGVVIQTGHEISRYDRKNKVIRVGKNPVQGDCA